MTLVWKLLRQHISIPQFVGFFFANLFGMFIVMLGVQFYRDVIPVFTANDSFLSSDYLIVSKKIGSAATLSGRSHDFSNAEIDDLAAQPFVRRTGRFVGAEYKVEARMGINGQSLLNTELPFESVPDNFIDVSSGEWKFTPGTKTVPIILPRSYINMYNFGFARSHNLPKISDGLVGMIDMVIFIHADGRHDEYKGRVIGFSNRLNSILVPQSFIEWSNEEYAPGQQGQPNRLMMEVQNPADERIAQYLEQQGYEVEDDKLQAEKTTYFLKMVVLLVMAIGLVISILSFYILMLSIYLLVQKNASKLENLLLIGYSPNRVSRPYQLITILLNILVLLIAIAVLFFVRNYYMGIVELLFPQIPDGGMLPAIGLGILLLLFVSLFNMLAIRRKVMNIWNRNCQDE